MAKHIDLRLMGALLAVMQDAPGNRHADSLEFPHRELWQTDLLVAYMHREDGDWNKWFDAIARHLQELSRLGWIRPAQPRVDAPGLPWDSWRLSAPDEINEHLLLPVREQQGTKDESGERDRGGNGTGRGSGGNGGRRGGGGDTGEPGAGGTGIRGVLGHPTLFALPTDEFEGFVDKLFEGTGSP